MKIKINGPIISNDDKWIYDLFEIEATSPNDVVDKLVDGEEVEISINSYGGLVDAGNEIYTALMGHNGPVNIDVVMAGSAASIIAMAGKPTRISPVGQIMIHNVSMMSAGDYHDMDKASEILQKANNSLSNAYVIKTGLSKEVVLAKMDEETWLTANEAKELGFVDEIMFENQERPLMVADAGAGLIPQNVIEKVKEMQNTKPAINVDLDAEKIADLVLEKINQSEKREPQAENTSPFGRFFFNT
ncbi:head maturation protease, ClpP-related [Marinilactibacillus psychrotolerans]|uniref:head maturation protease, ClpP-related n=1 Tax=Marinilactibacillus psychrotolerans TaxID=191770 RepID=UPI000B86B59C|nr:head maturation protease, ClpP-related [Marinilactibacillus psychrotolerans]